MTYWPAANPPETRLAMRLATQWNAENPGVQVRVQPLPAGRSSEEVLLAAIVAKATPDVSSNVSSALHVCKRFGDSAVVEDFDIVVADGELLVLVGGSGSGKSTVLRMVAGLEEVTSGTIRIDQRDITPLPPRERDVAMVFQDYGLYPHMTVCENLSLGLRLRKIPRPEIDRRVTWAAGTLGLVPLLDRKPKQLPGGQRQRVAMGRAMVREPKVFLFDEPLSNLDAGLRAQMRIEIGGLQRRLKTTTIYVTHDQVEAMTLGDRTVVLADGRIQQVGRPIELYRAPVNRFVAGFIGTPPMNFVEGGLREDNGQVFFIAEGISIKVPREKTAKAMEPLTLGIRPEDLRVDSSGDRSVDGGRPGEALTGRVVLVERLGGTSHVHFEVEGGRNRMMASVSNDRCLTLATASRSVCGADKCTCSPRMGGPSAEGANSPPDRRDESVTQEN